MADIEDKIRKLIESGDIGISWDGPRQMWRQNGKLPAEYSRHAVQFPKTDKGSAVRKQNIKNYPDLRTHPDYADRYKDQDT
jgi:hypothetical protein